MGRRACLERWYAWSGPRDVVAVRGHELKGPAFYHAAASVESVHRADAAAVRAVLPSDELLPVRWFDGRAAVYVSGLRYQDVTAAHADGRPWVLRPYGEFMAAVLVARRPVPRGLSVLRPDAFGVGAFVLSLPVTTVEALTLGRDLFGLPKFVADLDFQDEPASQVVTVAEDGRQVLALEVRPRGTARTYCATNVLYSSLRSELLETRVAVLGHRRVRLGPGAGLLSLGDHPVAALLRSLGVDASPVLAASTLGLRLVMPAGVVVGPARPYEGHRGVHDDRDGRFTVHYPGAPPFDRYAVPPGELGPLAELGQLG